MNLNNFNTDEHDLFEIPRISSETITLTKILFLFPHLYNKLSKTNLPFIKIRNYKKINVKETLHINI